MEILWNSTADKLSSRGHFSLLPGKCTLHRLQYVT